MRTTASYDLFPDAPSERAMARARWLAREGRVGDAERAYRDVLATQPELKQCWAEYFELLRRHGRRDDALRLADGCTAQFAEDAFSLTLRGAAQRQREGVFGELRGAAVSEAQRVVAAAVAPQQLEVL